MMDEQREAYRAKVLAYIEAHSDGVTTSQVVDALRDSVPPVPLRRRHLAAQEYARECTRNALDALLVSNLITVGGSAAGPGRPRRWYPAPQESLEREVERLRDEVARLRAALEAVQSVVAPVLDRRR